MRTKGKDGMANFLVSGLVNVETSVRVRGFPVPYYPIDYPFFGVGLGVSGVGFNVEKALKMLGNRVSLRSLIGRDALKIRISGGGEGFPDAAALAEECRRRGL